MLNFRTDTFLRLRQDMDSLAGQNMLTTDKVKAMVKAKGIDLKDFLDANDKFMASGQTYDNLESDTSTLDTVIAGGLSLIEGGGSLGKALLKSNPYTLPIATAVENTAEVLGEYVPDAVKSSYQAMSDPFTGDSLVKGITKDISGIFMGGGALLKLGKKAIVGGSLAPNIARFYNKLGRKSKFAVRNTSYGIPFATAQTIVEDPRQNSYDMIKALMSNDPKAMEALQNLDTDPTALDYLDAFVKNVGVDMTLSLGLATGFKGIAKGFKAGKNSKIAQKITPLGIGKKVTDFSKKYLTSRMGTDDVTLASLVKRDASGKAAMTRADGMAKDFERFAKEEFGDRAKDGKFREDIFNTYLQLKRNPLTNEIENPPANIIAILDNAGGKTRQALDDMRKSVSELGNNLSGKVHGTLGAIINKSAKEGTYLLRSYDFYDDPKFKKKLQERIRNRGNAMRNGVTGDDITDNAFSYLQKQFPTASNQEITEKLLKLAGDTPNEQKSFADFVTHIANRNAIKITGKPLTKRIFKEPALRDLFGEVKDPTLNYVKTYEKLALFKAENDFLEEVAIKMNSNFNTRIADIIQANKDAMDNGLTSFQFEGRTISTSAIQNKSSKQMAMDEAKKGLVDMGEIGKDRINAIFGSKILNKKQMKNPLEHIYASDTYAEAIKNGLDVNFSDNKFVKAWLASKALSQTAKTVYSPQTHGRNIMGNAFIMLANGLLPTKTSLAKSMKVTAAKIVKGKNNKQLGEYMAKMQELGVTDSSIPAQTIRRNLESVLKDPDSYLDKTGVGKFAKKAQDLYQAEDDFFKVMHFERTKESLKKSFPEMGEEGIERMAAQRTRDLMPNYNLVPKAFKKLRAAPVGDFLSFPAEMTRISKNLIKYTMEDLGNSMKVVKDADGRIISTTVENPELLKSATKRLAGMTTIGLAGDYGYNLSKDIFNISDEEDNSLRMTAPRWETNQQRIYLSPINKDRNGHLGVDYINFGPIDPFSFIRSAAVGTHDLLLNNKEYNPLEEQKILYGIIDNTLSPFLSPSMVTEAGIALLQGRIPKDPEAADYFGNVFGTLAEPFLPGFVPTGRKTIDYFRSGVTSSFSTIKSGEVDPLAWAGLVRKRQDLTAGARFNFNPAFADINKASSLTNDLLKDPNETDPNKIFDGFRKTQVQRLEGFKDLRNLIQIYNELGMSTADIIKALSVNDLLKVQGKNINLVDAANDNYFIPYFPKLTDDRVGETFKRGVPETKMLELYNNLEGSRIE
jgi:hypothetical protein